MRLQHEYGGRCMIIRSAMRQEITRVCSIVDRLSGNRLQPLEYLEPAVVKRLHLARLWFVSRRERRHLLHGGIDVWMDATRDAAKNG